MMYIKQIVGMIMAVVFLGLMGFAQSDPLCSANVRGNANTQLQSYQDMYNPSPLLKQYFQRVNSSIDRNKKVSGLATWFDNKKGGCNNGGFLNDELSDWNDFWNIHAAKAGITNGTSLSLAEVTTMQNYIKDTCGLDMGTDGKLGKKTVNAVQFCNTLPCKNNCTRSWFAQHYTKLYTDEEGTTLLYQSNTFIGDPSGELYIKQSDLQSVGMTEAQVTANPGLGLVKEDACAIEFGGQYDVSTKAQTTVEDGECKYNGTADKAVDPFEKGESDAMTVIHKSTGKELSVATNQGGQCRFMPPSTVTDFEKIKTTYKSKNGVTLTDNVDCKTCPKNSKEVKLIAGGHSISVCEQCDPKLCNCGVKLNTKVPFIGRCIQYQEINKTGQGSDGTTVNSLNAFPILMGALMKILLSVVLVGCFATLIVGGVMMTVPDQYETGKGLVKKVVWTIAGLGVLGTILYLINPNFFV